MTAGLPWARPRSIRVTLLFWYAVILLASMAVLGTTLHRNMRSILYQEADRQLQYCCSMLEGFLGADDASLLREGRSKLPGGTLFAVYDASGSVRAAYPEAALGAVPTAPVVETRDHHRWRVEAAPGGGWLVAGRSVRAENHGIRRFLLVLFGTGAAVVVVALAGGVWLVNRALAPAGEIARTARRISAESLDERIPIERVPTELREVASALNESFARLDSAFAAQVSFTADASHELRTPIAILRSHLELAAMEVGDSEVLAERTEICLSTVQRMADIVESLLTLARADSGQLEIDRSEVDLQELVREEIAVWQPLAGARDVTLEADTEPVTVVGDAARLRELLGNLIDNAIRYNRTGGRVDVVLGRDSDAAVLRVTDTGIGIATEDTERVFERFFRADPSRARDQGGTGLGLAISQWIVAQHGGSVVAGSASSGGAEIVVRLPLREL